MWPNGKSICLQNRESMVQLLLSHNLIANADSQHCAELPAIMFFPELLRFFHKITALRCFFVNYIFLKISIVCITHVFGVCT